MKHIIPIVALVYAAILLAGCSQLKEKEQDMNSPLAKKLTRFAKAEITADVSTLSAGDRKALDKLIEAARLMDEMYLRQVWSANAILKNQLAQDSSPEGKLRYQMFMLNRGPWSGLDHDSAFVAGVPYPKPAGANYYPEDMTNEEFERWAAGLSKEDQEKARGFFYTVRRDENNTLKLVPYSVEYKQWLEPAAQLLREAADLTGNASLKQFLTTR
ncbi:MAG: hypothetical protein HY961_04515, partial [Ignavibacteriae bacterium]|nr:hypothetical protein [Ignavibacteriota bacterium]